ncbi:XapX domain-containing protein [Vulcanibacillus modesticaldus]|uniref:XapX domain-containing protein n=1 Tax=Vulcanibacillus modesticaldus TaxID=337097 RepID=A0A1D2YW09_9BACI|nr:DUF1427 family protein [Vulcanibacillus modesticaldus]OEF99863.1 XapX domain-containing protein [Vulcanibacillus modesticaldus]
MKDIIMATLSGGIVGFLFGLLRLPIPAPPALSGVMGVFGVYLGFQIYKLFF